MDEHAKTSKPGLVEKIIESPVPNEPDKAQIAIEGAEPLYRELRIENSLLDDHGNIVKLKPGEHVVVTIEAPKDTESGPPTKK
jgi:hypothetical protein